MQKIFTFFLVLLCFLQASAQKTQFAYATHWRILSGERLHGSDLSLFLQTSKRVSTGCRISSNFGRDQFQTNPLHFYEISLGTRFSLPNNQAKRFQLGLEHGFTSLIDRNNSVKDFFDCYDCLIDKVPPRRDKVGVFPGIYMVVEPQLRVWRNLHLQMGGRFATYFTRSRTSNWFFPAGVHAGIALRY
jgi:hypothetical protein